MTEKGQIPSNIDHQEGQHRADSGAPRASSGRRDDHVGLDYPHSESTFPQSRKILAEILAAVPDDEQAKIAAGNTARVYKFDVAGLTVPA